MSRWGASNCNDNPVRTMTSSTAGPERGSLYRRIVDQDTLDLVLGLTLLLLLLHGGKLLYSNLAIAAICVCAFVYRPLIRHPGFWLLIACVELFFTAHFHWLISAAPRSALRGSTASDKEFYGATARK